MRKYLLIFLGILLLIMCIIFLQKFRKEQISQVETGIGIPSFGADESKREEKLLKDDELIEIEPNNINLTIPCKVTEYEQVRRYGVVTKARRLYQLPIGHDDLPANTPVMITRYMNLNGMDFLYVIDRENLKWGIIRQERLMSVFQEEDSPARYYFDIILESTINEPNGSRAMDGCVVVTFDMCPSRRPMESEIFEYLAKFGKEVGYPIPVAFCMSADWILNHLSDFQQLVQYHTEGKLNITWVNHSYTHPKSMPFLADQQYDATFKSHEVIDTERIMIEYGVLPSVFFRFPGLIDSPIRLRELNELGLIPIHADAWLAKGEKPRDGSIILLHGNGNEHIGIEMFRKWVTPKEKQFINGQRKFVELQDLIRRKSRR